MTRIATMFIVLTVAISTGWVCGQIVSPPLRPVDQGVEDTGELSESFRDMQVDLRQPVGFSNVYQVPGQEDKFMRASGALYAVFPRSQYVRTSQGILAQVPADTVFYIGLPPADPTRAGSPTPQMMPDNVSFDTHAANYMDRRIDRSIGPSESAQTAAAMAREASTLPALTLTTPTQAHSQINDFDSASSAMTTVATDSAYRSRRVTQLIEQAAAAHLARQAASRGE